MYALTRLDHDYGDLVCPLCERYDTKYDNPVLVGYLALSIMDILVDTFVSPSRLTSRTQPLVSVKGIHHSIHSRYELRRAEPSETLDTTGNADGLDLADEAHNLLWMFWWIPLTL